MSDLAGFPRVPLAHLPTPLERLARLEAALDGPPLFVKRDDCTGLATGGNKTRKLEFLLGDARAKGADCVISFGALQSNHARQTAAAAARLGLSCELVLVDRVPHPEPAYTRSGNLLLDALLGAVVHRVADTDAAARTLSARLSALEGQGRTPYVIPTGGSDAIGALGYVDCALELARQCSERDIDLTTVVTATASAGTHAGLLAGFALAGADVRVQGINVYEPDAPQALEKRVMELAAATTALLGIPAVGDERLHIAHEFVGPGYGVPTPAMIDAVRRVARLEGLLLDPVYAGKAMAGLLSLLGSGALAGEGAVVFLHTGGSAGLFAYGESLLSEPERP